MGDDVDHYDRCKAGTGELIPVDLQQARGCEPRHMYDNSSTDKPIGCMKRIDLDNEGRQGFGKECIDFSQKPSSNYHEHIPDTERHHRLQNHDCLDQNNYAPSASTVGGVIRSPSSQYSPRRVSLPEIELPDNGACLILASFAYPSQHPPLESHHQSRPDIKSIRWHQNVTQGSDLGKPNDLDLALSGNSGHFPSIQDTPVRLNRRTRRQTRDSTPSPIITDYTDGQEKKKEPGQEEIVPKECKNPYHPDPKSKDLPLLSSCPLAWPMPSGLKPPDYDYTSGKYKNNDTTPLRNKELHYASHEPSRDDVNSKDPKDPILDRLIRQELRQQQICNFERIQEKKRREMYPRVLHWKPPKLGQLHRPELKQKQKYKQEQLQINTTSDLERATNEQSLESMLRRCYELGLNSRRSRSKDSGNRSRRDLMGLR